MKVGVIRQANKRVSRQNVLAVWPGRNGTSRPATSQGHAARQQTRTQTRSPIFLYTVHSNNIVASKSAHKAKLELPCNLLDHHVIKLARNLISARLGACATGDYDYSWTRSESNLSSLKSQGLPRVFQRKNGVSWCIQGVLRL